MHTLHTLRLPTPPAAGLLAGLTDLTASLIGRPIAALIAAWRRQAADRATARTLHALDDRTLHDLGMHRSEIGGFAAEIGGQADISYVRAQLVHHLRA